MADDDEWLRALLQLPLTDIDDDPLAVHRRMLNLAQRGVAAPESMSLLDIKQVCYALEVRYAGEGLH